jgi:hypothetical protein
MCSTFHQIGIKLHGILFRCIIYISFQSPFYAYDVPKVLKVSCRLIPLINHSIVQMPCLFAASGVAKRMLYDLAKLSGEIRHLRKIVEKQAMHAHGQLLQKMPYRK